MYKMMFVWYMHVVVYCVMSIVQEGQGIGKYSTCNSAWK